MVAGKHSAMLVTVVAFASTSGLCQLKTDMAPRLEFEVASIKPCNPNANGGGIKPLPGGQSYVAKNAPLKVMIKLMFHLNNRQISGGTGWLDDFKLEWTPELPPGLAARPEAAVNPPPTNGPDIFTALREQLGLKLDSHKGPVEVMVIDHVERPSEN